MKKITLATTCMGRTHHLMQTLPANLKANRYPNVEFLILDYNSRDGLADWIRQDWGHRLGQDINFYSERSQQQFFTAHAKNVAALLAKGEIVVNVDADHFIDRDLGWRIAHALPRRRMLARAGMQRLGRMQDMGGLIGCYASDFRLLGGYDELMWHGWGFEDTDLALRAMALGFVLSDLHTNGHALVHSDESRNALTTERLPPTASANLHKRLHQQSMRFMQYVANVGQVIGRAEVVHNFQTPIAVGFTPSPISLF